MQDLLSLRTSVCALMHFKDSQDLICKTQVSNVNFIVDLSSRNLEEKASIRWSQALTTSQVTHSASMLSASHLLRNPNYLLESAKAKLCTQEARICLDGTLFSSQMASNRPTLRCPPKSKTRFPTDQELSSNLRSIFSKMQDRSLTDSAFD